MKQNSFALGFIIFFVFAFIALWANDGFSRISLWGGIIIFIPCSFVGLFGGAIAMLMAKNKKDKE